MRWLALFAIAASLSACDAPWDGPTSPDGSRPLALTELEAQGVPDAGPDIVASTSMDAIRAHVVAHAIQEGQSMLGRPPGYDPCAQYGEEVCWPSVSDTPGRVFIAVITNYLCNGKVKEVAAVAGPTVYFIHWAGASGGVCNAAMAMPNWRLYYARRSDLPSGKVTVRLLLQGLQQGSVDSQINL